MQILKKYKSQKQKQELKHANEKVKRNPPSSKLQSNDNTVVV